jgi:translation elongation factor EF-G
MVDEILLKNVSTKQGQKIYNVSRDTTEKTGRLYVASADELNEVQSLSEGNIAVVTGLKVRCRFPSNFFR